MRGADTFLISFLELTGLDRARPHSSLEDEVALMFRQWRTPLLRYLFTLGLPAHDAEEVTQEVFLALFRHLQNGKPRTNLRAWVFRAGHNLGLRARTHSQRSVTLDPQQSDHRDPAPTPEDQVAQSQRRRKLMAVLQALPPREQACIHLRAEGLKYREIADILGISLGSVAQSMERALRKLHCVEEV